MWDESFRFRVDTLDDVVAFDVWDQDVFSDEFLGEVCEHVLEGAWAL